MLDNSKVSSDILNGMEEILDENGGTDPLANNNCSMIFYEDKDQDGYGDSNFFSCKKLSNYAENSGDCNDNNPTIFPGNTEECDGKDNNCDGLIDEWETRECHTACGSGIEKCIERILTPCDAPLPQMEVLDSKDNDCDGLTDEIPLEIWFRKYTTEKLGRPCCVSKTAEENILQVINYHLTGAPEGPVIMETDYNGDIVWKNKFPGNFGQLHSIAPLQNNRYVLGGSFNPEENTTFGMVFQINSQGDIIWQKNHGKSPSYIYDVQPTTDGGFIAVGENKGYEEVVANLWVLKLNSEGEKEWEKNLLNSPFSRGERAIEISGQKYLISGNTTPLGMIPEFNWWTLLLDNPGNKLWDSTYFSNGPGDMNEVYSVSQCNNKLCVRGSGIEGLFLLEYDSLGKLVQEQAFPFDSTYQISQIKSEGEQLLVLGAKYFSPEQKYGWLIKFLEGKPEWEYTFYISNSSFRDVQIINKGTYVIAGYLEENDTTIPILVKLSQDTM